MGCIEDSANDAGASDFGIAKSSSLFELLSRKTNNIGNSGRGEIAPYEGDPIVTALANLVPLLRSIVFIGKSPLGLCIDGQRVARPLTATSKLLGRIVHFVTDRMAMAY
jgi:hypothetical protein